MDYRLEHAPRKGICWWTSNLLICFFLGPLQLLECEGIRALRRHNRATADTDTTVEYSRFKRRIAFAIQLILWPFLVMGISAFVVNTGFGEQKFARCDKWGQPPENIRKLTMTIQVFINPTSYSTSSFGHCKNTKKYVRSNDWLFVAFFFYDPRSNIDFSKRPFVTNLVVLRLGLAEGVRKNLHNRYCRERPWFVHCMNINKYFFSAILCIYIYIV